MKIKNKILTAIQIDSIAAEGKCVARVDGRVVFVSGVAPGDVVDLRIVKKRKSYLEAVPVRFHEYSAIRQEPFCSHFGTCGGCKWQHIEYDYQLKYKQQQVVDALQRIAKMPLPEISPILGADKTTYYRNKLEYTFSDKRWLTTDEIQTGNELERRALGFHIPGRFDKIIDIDHCYLQPEPSNKIRLSLKIFCQEEDIPFFDLMDQTGYMRNLIIRTASTGETMIVIQVAANKPLWLKKITGHLINEFPETTSMQYIINTKRNETFHDQEVVCFYGKPYITEEMVYKNEDLPSLRFRIGPKSFYQTNSEQAANLYDMVSRMAGFSGNEKVYDLYTGTGTIANYVAPLVHSVVGIEYIEAAVKDARINALDNHIANTTFHSGDIKQVFTEEFIRQHGKPDVVITDPPRAGMHEDVVRVLLNANPEKIIYVSCNPATQARDLSLLSENYHLTAIQPVDMFPHTYHVENIVCLDRNG